jgi:hypothetical protein
MLQRTFLWAALACSLGLAAHAAGGVAVPAAPLDLNAVFDDALHCRTGFPDARDPDMAERLHAAGVVTLDRAPGETLDLFYVFPQPLHIAGTRITAISVRGDSGGIVAARATGDLRALVQRSKARPHARSQWDLDGFDELPAQFSREMPIRPGMDAFKPRLVMGHVAGDAPGSLRWGCRSYDG